MRRIAVLVPLLLLYVSVLVSSQGTWSEWTCYNATIANRSRTTQNCSPSDPPPTECVETTTDVVVNVTLSEWSPSPVTCSDSTTVGQTRLRTCGPTPPIIQCSPNCTNGTDARNISTQICTESDFGSWSVWSCTNDTAGVRTRTTTGCVSTDPTFCTAAGQQVTTDVVSQSAWSQWAPMPPACGATSEISQMRSQNCETPTTVTCSNQCLGGRTQSRDLMVPICCDNLGWTAWVEWGPTDCPPNILQQSRMRYRLPCPDSSTCETNCANETQTRPVTMISWSNWGQWSSMSEQQCDSGQRTRERTCSVSSSIMAYCADCAVNTADTMDGCCNEVNIWTVWSAWTDPTISCPRTRSRTRSCVADSSVTDTSKSVCSTSCQVNEVELDTQSINAPECADIGSGTGTTVPNTADSSFPTWAIGVVSAVGVIVVIALFIGITYAGKKLSRRQKYDIGDANVPPQPLKDEEEVNPTYTAHNPTGGIPPHDSYTAVSDTLQYRETSYGEKQF